MVSFLVGGRNCRMAGRGLARAAGPPVPRTATRIALPHQARRIFGDHDRLTAGSSPRVRSDGLHSGDSYRLKSGSVDETGVAEVVTDQHVHTGRPTAFEPVTTGLGNRCSIPSASGASTIFPAFSDCLSFLSILSTPSQYTF